MKEDRAYYFKLFELAINNEAWNICENIIIYLIGTFSDESPHRRYILEYLENEQKQHNLELSALLHDINTEVDPFKKNILKQEQIKKINEHYLKVYSKLKTYLMKESQIPND
jgi:hypothetical protein